MMIGLGFQDPDSPGDRVALEEIGCSKIFLRTTFDRKNSVKEFMGLAELLRPGDTIAVVDLDRLGSSLEEIVAFVAKLHSSGIRIRAKENEIISGTPNSEMLGQACVALNNVTAALARKSQG